jgi:hypothetical protein
MQGLGDGSCGRGDDGGIAGRQEQDAGVGCDEERELPGAVWQRRRVRNSCREIFLVGLLLFDGDNY